MKNLVHLTHEEMVLLIDGELDAVAQGRVETHLADCAECLKRYEDLAEFSGVLNHSIESFPVAVPPGARQRLEAAMGQHPAIRPMRPIRWWQWAAVAAGLIIMLALLHPRRSSPVEVKPASPSVAKSTPSQTAPVSSAIPKPTITKKRPLAPSASHRAKQDPSFENAFIRLPYSDPSLPINTADVVRVEIPLSALANSGVIRTPPGTADALVKAEVLLGLDGQPSAIRLVSARMDAN
ncbi:MAG TPA: zf-HC2 domain-containing protein [Bryobacteraceae bacterium]